jgi:hypothetical protein
MSSTAFDLSAVADASWAESVRTALRSKKATDLAAVRQREEANERTKLGLGPSCALQIQIGKHCDLSSIWLLTVA